MLRLTLSVTYVDLCNKKHNSKNCTEALIILTKKKCSEHTYINAGQFNNQRHAFYTKTTGNLTKKKI